MCIPAFWNLYSLFFVKENSFRKNNTYEKKQTYKKKTVQMQNLKECNPIIFFINVFSAAVGWDRRRLESTQYNESRIIPSCKYLQKVNNFSTNIICFFCAFQLFFFFIDCLFIVFFVVFLVF